MGAGFTDAFADTAWLFGATDEKPKKKKKDGSKDGSRAGSVAGDGPANSVDPIQEIHIGEAELLADSLLQRLGRIQNQYSALSQFLPPINPH